MPHPESTNAEMPRPILRKTVDLSGFPDLVVIYLGMTVNHWTGLKTLFGFGPKIAESVEAHPDGLLLHEPLLWSMLPPHVGMRQYWRDFDALERWARSDSCDSRRHGPPRAPCSLPEVERAEPGNRRCPRP